MDSTLTLYVTVVFIAVFCHMVPTAASKIASEVYLRKVEPISRVKRSPIIPIKHVVKISVELLYHQKGIRHLPPSAIESKILGQKAMSFLLHGAEKESMKRSGKWKGRRPQKTIQYRKPGNFRQALKDFNMLRPVDITMPREEKVYSKTGRIGNMMITLRSSSKSYPKQATIDIYDIETKNLSKHNVYKFRYMGKNPYAIQSSEKF